MRFRWGAGVIMVGAALGIVLPSAAVGAVAPTPTSTAAASASPVAPPAYVPIHGASSSAEPLDGVFKNVDYNGGPVMPSNTDYLVFWSPRGLSAYGPGATPEYVSGLSQYFKDLSHDSGGSANSDSVSTQYNDATGASVHYQVTFGGVLLDTDGYPKSQCPVQGAVTECLTDAQVQAELEKVVAAHYLRHDLTHEYFLLTPPHVEGCFTGRAPSYGGCSAGEVPTNLGVYCAYHQNTTLSPMLLYSVDPYVTGNGGCDDGNHPNGPSDGALIGGLSHEHNESITDPIPNDAWTNGAGANHGEENGDQCDGQMGASLGTAPDGAHYNQVVNGHFYWYQEEWSNKGHTCLQRLPTPTPGQTATFTVTAGKGLSMTFDAGGSAARGGIADYVWQFNDAFGASTIEKSTPTITHTFPAAGTYSVGLTTYTHDGASVGAGGIVTTGHSGFTTGFTASPSAPGKGQQVTFTGLSTISREQVRTYLWEFGDGATASGPEPTHAYAKAGTYTVTLVLFSGVGSAYPGAGAAPIVTRRITVG